MSLIITVVVGLTILIIGFLYGLLKYKTIGDFDYPVDISKISSAVQGLPYTSYLLYAFFTFLIVIVCLLLVLLSLSRINIKAEQALITVIVGSYLLSAINIKLPIFCKGQLSINLVDTYSTIVSNFQNNLLREYSVSLCLISVVLFIIYREMFCNNA